MGDRHQQVALHRGPHHAIELELQTALLVFLQRHGHAHLAREFGPVAQEEEQQVEHDEKADNELERALAKTEHLIRHLATGHRALDDFLPQPVQLTHAEPIKQMLEIRWQVVLELRHIAGNVQLTAFDALVQRRAFLNQQHADDDHRQNRDHQTDAQGAQRSQVALPAELQLQPALHRRKDNPQDHRPEHRAVERQQDPDERNAHQHQQNRQRFIFQRLFVHVRSMSVHRHATLCPDG
ncbi:hypothetical protein D3C84_795740 [compost metagenome]